MFGRIKQIVWGALWGTLIATQALGQTATLLPNARQQFFTPQGIPAAAGTVDFYIPSTTTRKTTWNTSTESVGTQNPNPVLLDSGGMATIYGDGAYRQVVKDSSGNTIWDAVTASTGGGSPTPGPTVGDGNIVGTILPWAGLVAPPNYVFAYGQAISRTTYPLFTSTVTIVANLICTSGLNVLSGIADTSQIRIGAPVEASCVAPGTTVTAVASTSVTVSNNASLSTAISATFFPYGNGDGSTTLNVPDLRGQTLAGRNNMGGTGVSTLTSTYFGTSPNALGAAGGAQSYAFLQSNLPNTTINPTFTGTPTGTLTSNEANVLFSSGGVDASGTGGVTWGQGHVTIPTFTPAGTIAFPLNGGVTQTQFSLIQPTTTMNYVIKVMPDTSTTVASGVASLGGMTGVIACGTGVVCGSQTISVQPGIPLGSAPVRPVVHPSSGNLVGTGCIAGEAHTIWWVDQNLCSAADVWQITSSDPSAAFSLIIGGSVTTGDAISLTITMGSGNCSGAGCTVIATAVGGDTLTTLAGKLACAIANNSSLFNLNGGSCAGGAVSPAVVGGVTGGYGGGNPVGFVVINGVGLAFDFNSNISLKVTSSVSGSATETVTIANTTCGTRCSYALDNNPAFQMVRNAGIAPQPASVLNAIYSIGGTSACPTSTCVNYGAITSWVGNSTAGSIQSAWLLQTPNTSGTMAGGWWFGQGLYANAGGAPFSGSAVADLGIGTINLPTQTQVAGAGIYFNNTDSIKSAPGSSQFAFNTSNAVVFSGGLGVGLNAVPTGSTFTSGLGAFVSGTQTPTTGSGWSLQGGTTPVLAAKNYATAAWLATSLQVLSIDFQPSGSATSGATLSANQFAPDATNATTLGAASLRWSTVYGVNFDATGSMLSSSPTAGVGYKTGAGGAVTQTGSRTTGVTLNTDTGAITLFAAAPAVGTWVSFTVTDSAVAAADVPHVAFKSGTNTYIGHVTAVAAGSFQISFTSIVGTSSDSPVINFAIMKGSAN